MEKIIDKSKELYATVSLINDKLNFRGIVEGKEPVSIDYVSPLGDDLGYTSLELLLLSLSSCLASTTLSFLRKMKKTIKGFEIHSKGVRREEHPTGFKIIIMEFKLKSPDTTKEELSRAIELSEETYCPVWAMLKGNVEIEIIQNISL